MSTATKSKQKVPLAEFRWEAVGAVRCLTYRAERHIRVPTITRKIVHDFTYYNAPPRQREMSEKGASFAFRDYRETMTLQETCFS